MAHLSQKPVYHFIAPRGWMNDPCAPGYDPRTGLYHLFYQWTPHSHRWDKIAWGHATSEDIHHWTHASPDTPALKPDTEYDKEGVFTGCFWPEGPKGEQDQDILTVFYTNVLAAPHFSKSHIRGRIKYPANPIINQEPKGLDITGFRDPFVGPWIAMDQARGTPGRLYGLISGGVHGQGPRTFLYDVNPKDLTNWTYLFPLLRSHPVHSRPGGKWRGDLGLNLECTNFTNLVSESEERQVILTGSEGGVPRPRGGVPRYGVWLMGSLEGEGKEVDLSISAAGMVDGGSLYAFNTMKNGVGSILWGWLIEEDLSDAILAQRGWTGCLGVPRQLFLESYTGVHGTLKSNLADIGSLQVLPNGEVLTLGIRPLPELVKLRGDRLFQVLDSSESRFRFDGLLACAIELVVDITDDTDEVTFHVRQSDSVRTSISFFPKEEVIKLYREHSNDCADILKSTEEGPFSLFRFVSSGIENLRLVVLLDGDVLEVFANDRFALATRVYSPADATGVAYEHKRRAQVKQFELWEMKATQ
ncbi:hypothetical protein CspHIS471_0102130 [Cutaneotrichosporon sp. HIS471]|nr:hypothetical protein CspHIS471_0102130 [Cutaneotrichosporon sp. HIS471]